MNARFWFCDIYREALHGFVIAEVAVASRDGFCSSDWFDKDVNFAVRFVLGEPEVYREDIL